MSAPTSVSDEQLLALEVRLNHADVIDGRYYRRNVVEYPLVTAVNHIVALRRSANLPGMITFLSRAREELPAIETRLNAPYLEAVRAYLVSVRAYLLASPALDPADEDEVARLQFTNS
jgi:hypothetical protein